jgi:DNA-binding transcriptional ArsR family regulator
MLKGLFGSETAEKVILFLAHVGEGHIRGIAANFKLSPGQVDRTIKRLEAAGILVAKQAGRTRLFQLNPHLAVKKELIALADKAISVLPEHERSFYIQRRRPRRTGKRL